MTVKHLTISNWHHWLDGHESEWTPGVGDGQGGLACCDSQGRKESDMTERLIWSESIYLFMKHFLSTFHVTATILGAGDRDDLVILSTLKELVNVLVRSVREIIIAVASIYGMLHFIPGACVCAKLVQYCLTLCDPMDCSPPSSSVHGILLSRILEWVAVPSSRESSWPRDRIHISWIAGRFFTSWATGEDHVPGRVLKTLLVQALLIYSSILLEIDTLLFSFHRCRDWSEEELA